MSSDALREAARRRLLSMEGQGAAGGEVTRVVLDVTAGGRTEVVTVMLRDGELAVSSTGGAEDPLHVAAALELLAGEDVTSPGAITSPGRLSTPASGETRLSSPGTVRTVDDTIPASADRSALADALSDVLTAIVRVGVREARTAATVEEAVERITAAAPRPLPLGIGRWIGLLRGAMATLDVDTLARVLEGASQVAIDLRNPQPGPSARRRIVAWLGATADTPGDVERVSDRTLVEVARELLSGLERAAIERRYLMCLDTGEIFREERPRGGVGVSVGPCPRLVSVGLGEVEEGAPPRRIRLLQYAVNNRISADDWVRLEDLAHRSFETLAREYREALGAYPGLAEPFVVVAPAACEREPDFVLLDASDDPLPVAAAEEPAFAQAVRELASEEDPAWVAGRLVDADGALLLIPCATAMRDGPGRRVLRIA